MTLLAHGAFAAGLTSLFVVTAGGNPNYGIVAGAVLGTAPDLWDWIAWKVFSVPRWTVYLWFHHECPVWLLIVLFPMGIHISMDRIVHRIPGLNWWPAYWYLEILLWVTGISMIAFSYLIWAVT
jgi:hypothetical protein